MKRILFSLTAIVMLLIGTAKAQCTFTVTDNTPYTYGFEDSTLNCWTTDTVVGTSVWTLNTSNANSGVQSAAFGTSGAGNAAMLISPVINLSGITGTAKISFYHMHASVLIGGAAVGLDVYYRNSPTDAWTSIGSFTSTASAFTLDSIFVASNSATFQIAFKGTVNSSYNYLGTKAYVDDITIENADGPVGPVVEDECDPIAVTVNSLYTENFNSYNAVSALDTLGEMATCWHSIYTGSSAGYNPNVYNGTYTPIAGDNSLEITSGARSLFGLITLANAGVSNYAIMPEFTNSLNELQLLFSTAMSTDTTGTLTLGFVTNAADASTFTPIVDITSNNYAVVRRVDHVINLANYAVCNNAHGRLAFRWSDASTTALSTVCIDNVTARIALSCAEPTDLLVYSIGPNDAMLDWTPGDATQSQWEVDCIENGVITSFTANTHPFQLTNLTASTDYTVQVRAICGANDSSYWSTAIDFTSACPISVVDDNNPFMETFPTQDFGCWYTAIYEGNDNWELSYSSHSGTFGATYSNSVFGDLMGTNEPSILDLISMFSSMTSFGTGSAYLVSPILDLSGLTVPAQLTFYRRQHSMMIPLTLQILYRTNPNNIWSYIGQITTTTMDWTRESFILPSPSSTYQIAFVSYVDMNNMENMMGDLTNMTQSVDMSSIIDLDDIRIGANADCDVPTNITITYEDQTNLTLTWTGGNAPSYNIEYGETGFAHGNGTNVIANNNTYTFSNLTAGTTYDFYIQGNCGGENISDWCTVFTHTMGGTQPGIHEYNGRLQIFPNPTNGKIEVSNVSMNGDTQVKVYDIFGNLLIDNTMVATSGHITLDLGNFANGTYIIRATDGKNIWNGKVVKD